MLYRNFVLTAIIALLLSNCKSIQLESRWLDRSLSYKGKVSEWNDCIVYPKDTKFGIGVMNDDKFLYLCMTSWDANVSAQIIRRGFTVMFEPKDGKGNRLGIHYPMGIPRSGLRHEKEEGPEIMKEKLAESLEHVEILGPGKDDTCPTRTIISESMGIITRVVASEGNCVYEMKVPLKADSVNKFAINAGPGETIRLTLETSPANVKKRTLPQANPPVPAARTWAEEWEAAEGCMEEAVMAREVMEATVREAVPEGSAPWNRSNSHLP